jgi:hypothetical protein
MNSEWNDKERAPRRMVQMFDPVAQETYRNWSAELKLEWLESLLKLYWAGRRENSHPASNAAEQTKPYDTK